MIGGEGPIRFKYTGKALPDNADVVVLFSTGPTLGVPGAFPFANGLQALSINRIYVAIQNSQAGTLKAYKSDDHGVTWVQIIADQAVATAAANSENINDYLVEPYADWKLTWTNGATIQTVFGVSINGVIGERNVGN